LAKFLSNRFGHDFQLMFHTPGGFMTHVFKPAFLEAPRWTMRRDIKKMAGEPLLLSRLGLPFE
jgi:hypothetical protein